MGDEKPVMIWALSSRYAVSDPRQDFRAWGLIAACFSCQAAALVPGAPDVHRLLFLERAAIVEPELLTTLRSMTADDADGLSDWAKRWSLTDGWRLLLAGDTARWYATHPCRREHSLLCRRNDGSDSLHPWLMIVRTAVCCRKRTNHPNSAPASPMDLLISHLDRFRRILPIGAAGDVLRVHRDRKSRAHARFAIDSPRTAKSDGLNGGAEGI